MSTSELTALVTAITALVIAIAQMWTALSTHSTVNKSAATVEKIDAATNGALEQQKSFVSALQSSQATPDELAARTDNKV